MLFGAVAGSGDGGPLEEQAPFWFAVGFGMLALVAGVVAVADALIGSQRDEQQEVAASQARLEKAEGQLVYALNQQAVSSLFEEGWLARIQVPPASDSDEVERPEPLERPADRQPLREEAALLTLSALWDTTHARLKLYHDVALGQANRSFRSAQWAMWMGFVALGAFVAIALKASSTAGSVVAGGLGAVAAGLAGFIGRTFVRSQETAAGHLRSYFDQPLELSRYLAAERLVADPRLSQEQRAEILTVLVTAMVQEPQPAVDRQAEAPPKPTEQP
ncbi:hypothetical protein [Streptomyces sp. NPDC096934]|uniref:hypothetical protein n=1 Tax=Streptomyces sp. NPDC096934 TaxID=3155551 RepID=UPI0033347D81